MRTDWYCGAMMTYAAGPDESRLLRKKFHEDEYWVSSRPVADDKQQLIVYFGISLLQIRDVVCCHLYTFHHFIRVVRRWWSVESAGLLGHYHPHLRIVDRGTTSRMDKRVAPNKEGAADKQCTGEGKTLI